MKCSDCKYYKTEECKLKPEAEYFVAEKFDCFELDANRETAGVKASTVTQGAKDAGRDWGYTIGGIIVFIGVTGIIISLLGIASACSRIHIVDTEDVGPVLICGIVLVVSFFITLFGGIWWFIDSMAERRYWKSFETHDSQSDNNKATKENFERLLRDLKNPDKTEKP